MRATSSFHILLGFVFCSAGSLLSAQNTVPTKDDVRDAVQNYFGPDTKSVAAQKNLKLWGNAALPHLEALAMEPTSKKNGWDIVVSIREIGTPEATKLLIGIASGKTQLAPREALNIFDTMIDLDDKRRLLENSPEFKSTVFGLASPKEDWFTKSQAVRIMAGMKWMDGLPLMEEMLKDENLSSREAAAQAIQDLTGRKPTLERPKLSFPSTDLDVHLIEHIGRLPKAGLMSISASLGQWFDGKRGILQWEKGALVFYGADLRQQSRMKSKKVLHDLFMAPTSAGGCRIVALASDRDMFEGEYAYCADSRGKTLWEDHPKKARAEALAPLYGEGGLIKGAILGYGGEDGIVITDLEGKRIKQIERYHVLYHLSTHPLFPNTFVACGGNIDLFVLDGDQLKRKTSDRRFDIYATEAAVFSDPNRKLRVVVAGKKNGGGAPQIACLDEDLEIVWRATVPRRVAALTRVDTAGTDDAPLFVAVTGGERLTFDGSGKLLNEMPHNLGDPDNVSIYGVSSGMLDAHSVGLLIGFLDGWSVYKFKM